MISYKNWGREFITSTEKKTEWKYVGNRNIYLSLIKSFDEKK
jgi:hypothetical protein